MNGGMALVLVDIQNDFLPGGALAVPKGDEVVATANRLIKHFPFVVATQDWHPPSHGSFASSHPGRAAFESGTLAGLPQVLWPDHCVENSRGAELAEGLDTGGVHEIVRKGTDPQIDSYSGFFDNGHRKETGLLGVLKGRGVTHVVLMGLATDYCVKATALDARSLGLEVSLVVDGCRGVDLAPGDSAQAVLLMAAAGVRLVSSADLADGAPVREIHAGRFVRLLAKGTWEYASRTKTSGVVGILPITNDGHVVLIEQFRVPVGRRVVEIPAGLAGDGGEAESLEIAAARELLEETGYSSDVLERLGEFPSSAGLTDEIITLFVGSNARRVAEPVSDGHEEITVHVVAGAEVDRFLASRVAAGCLVDAKIAACLWMKAADAGRSD